MSWKDILVIVSDAEGDAAALALGEALGDADAATIVTSPRRS